MASQSLRFWLAAVIFLLAVVILVVSFWPEVRNQQVVPMPPVVLPTATPVALAAPVAPASPANLPAFGDLVAKGL